MARSACARSASGRAANSPGFCAERIAPSPLRLASRVARSPGRRWHAAISRTSRLRDCVSGSPGRPPSCPNPIQAASRASRCPPTATDMDMKNLPACRCMDRISRAPCAPMPVRPFPAGHVGIQALGCGPVGDPVTVTGMAAATQLETAPGPLPLRSGIGHADDAPLYTRGHLPMIGGVRAHAGIQGSGSCAPASCARDGRRRLCRSTASSSSLMMPWAGIRAPAAATVRIAPDAPVASCRRER